MERGVDQYHPDRIIDSRLGQRLSRRWRFHLRAAVVVLSWYGLASSCLGIITSLSWIIDGARWLIANAAAFKPLLMTVGDSIHFVVEVWRTLTEPIYRILFGWLPFSVPREVLDATIIASIVSGGYLRAWMATANERRIMAVFDDKLSQEGKYAVVKRIQTANRILSGPYPQESKDKAEVELVGALEDMTRGISDKDFKIVEATLDMEPDELDAFLYGCVEAEQKAAKTRSMILRRSIIVAGTLLFLVVIDVTYRMAL